MPATSPNAIQRQQFKKNQRSWRAFHAGLKLLEQASPPLEPPGIKRPAADLKLVPKEEAACNLATD